MKRVALLGFGGTIAMVPDENGVLAPAKNAIELLEYVPQLSKMADITVTQLENLDSTNVNPTHWKRLANEIDQISNDFDGVIVTHGTDTMSYTSSAVALALSGCLKLPVVFTGSQLPIVDPGNDARFNLENAMKTILKADELGIHEVMLVFADRVLRAARSIKTSESRFDAFDSPAFPYLAQITVTGVEFSPVALKHLPHKANLRPEFNSNIFTIDLSPGLDPTMLLSLLQSKKCEALLLKSLGAGNVPSEGPYSLLPLIKRATETNIPVLISTKFIGGRTLPEIYETGKLAQQAGAIPTGDMTDVMTQVKLMWLIALGIKSPQELRKAILSNYVGEVG